MAEASVDPSLQVSAMVADAIEQDEEAINQALTDTETPTNSNGHFAKKIKIDKQQPVSIIDSFCG